MLDYTITGSSSALSFSLFPVFLPLISSPTNVRDGFPVGQPKLTKLCLRSFCQFPLLRCYRYVKHVSVPIYYLRCGQLRCQDILNLAMGYDPNNLDYSRHCLSFVSDFSQYHHIRSFESGQVRSYGYTRSKCFRARRTYARTCAAKYNSKWWITWRERSSRPRPTLQAWTPTFALAFA